jgi:hypothetical protein
LTHQKWDLDRVEKLRAAMSDADIEALRKRELADPASLTVDEAGILFVATRERIRRFERKAGGNDGGG